MQTPIGRRPGQRWARFAGTGAVALLATTALASVAGAATPPAHAPSGASGSVAALSGTTMEVQNPSTGQTAVNWTTTTTFSKSVTEAVSSLAAGDCVTVTGAPSKSSKTTIEARSISVVAATSTGSCTEQFRADGAAGAGGANGPGGGGFRFGGGGEGGTTGGTRPTFKAGSGRGFAGSANIAIATGKVTGVSGSTVKVTGYDITPGQFGPNTKSTSKAKTPTTPKTESLKITTTSTTTVGATQTAAATDLAVGDCVSAFGPAATNGAVTATTVRITSTGGKTCTGGFAGFGGGGFRGGPGGGAPSGAAPGGSGA